jgi:hypothetical protein
MLFGPAALLVLAPPFGEHALLVPIDVGSVADPDPPDPHVFGPPGSGSISRGMDRDPAPDLNPSITKQKKVRKTLIPTASRLFFDFLSLKIMYMYLQKVISKKQKNFFLNLFFVGILGSSVAKISGSGSGSVSQRHGSTRIQIRIRIHHKMSWIRNTGRRYLCAKVMS